MEQTISKEVPIVVPYSGGTSPRLRRLRQIFKASHYGHRRSALPHRPHYEMPTEAVLIAGLKQPARFFVALNIKDNAIRTQLNNPVQADTDRPPPEIVHGSSNSRDNGRPGLCNLSEADRGSGLGPGRFGRRTQACGLPRVRSNNKPECCNTGQSKATSRHPE